jgi:hypothetical protein
MIDLSQYSGTDEEVKVTFRDDTSFTGKFFLYDKMKDTYLFASKESLNRIITRNGTSIFSSYKDIVKVELVNPEKPKQIPLNTLESKTLHAIASALTPEAIKYIESHDKYAEVMLNLLEEFLEKNLGNSTGELPFMIFDRIFLNKGTN